MTTLRVLRPNRPWEETIVTGRQFLTEFKVTTDDHEFELPAADFEARIEFRTAAGALITSMATSGAGSADGLITVTQHDPGTLLVKCTIDAADTDALAPSIDSTGTVTWAGWGDLKVWHDDVEAGQPQHGGRIHLRIYEGVTA